MVKLVYNYHPIYETYIGYSEADESPLEPGIYLIPAYATTVPPPTNIPSNHDIKWDSINQQWNTQEKVITIVSPETNTIEQISLPDAITQLRNYRNKLLKEVDWVAIKYFTRGESFPNEWANYFQALRDLPENSIPLLNSDGLLDMNSVNWPLKPLI